MHRCETYCVCVCVCACVCVVCVRVRVCACAYIDHIMFFICHTEVREVCYLSERLKGFCQRYILQCRSPQILITAQQILRSSVEFRSSWKCTLHTKCTHSSQFIQRAQYYLEKMILWVHPGIFEQIIWVVNAMWLHLQGN